MDRALWPMTGVFVLALVCVGVAAFCAGKTSGGQQWVDLEDPEPQGNEKYWTEAAAQAERRRLKVVRGGKDAA